MVSLEKFFLTAAAALMVLTSCAKAPEWSGDASVSFEAVKVENTDKYKVKVSAAVANDNSETAFTGMSGRIILKDAGVALLTLPFKSVTILPFEKGLVEAESVISDTEALKIADALKIEREKFLKEKGIKEHFLEKVNIDVTIESYDKSDIIKLLKDKVNEKSK